jgi:uncharacterized repeat protein (TIGR01451 family)
MQFKQMLKASLTPGRSLLATLVMVGVVASVLSFAPTHGAANTLAETCANPPATPTFNYWPVTYDDVNTPLCHDFPAIDAAVDASHPQFSQSEADWNDGLTLTDGQQGAALMYLHNGAANNLGDVTTAKDVKIITQTDTSVGATHQIKVTYSASNAATYTRTFTVKTPANAKLEVVPNSGALYSYEGHILQQGLDIGNSTRTLPELQACFEYSLFLSFKFKVVTPATPTNATLSITKGVYNITHDGATGSKPTYSSSVAANKGDQVGYQIAVTNTSSQVAKGVTMTDNPVDGITVDAGSVTVGSSDTTVLASNLWQGTIPGTISLGDLQPGESRIIKFTAHVTKDCITLVNTASAVATNAPSVSASASVVIDNCTTPGTPKITIKKLVKNYSTNSAFDDSSVDARTGERVTFKITVTNPSTVTLQNVHMTDVIPTGLKFDDSVSGDGTASFNNTTFTVDFGSISAGQSKSVEFSAQVLATADTTVCNIAKAIGTGVSEVQDNACVKVYTTAKPGTPNIVISKRAFNDTKNVDATSTNAARGDYITYTLVATNNGTADQTNYKFEDDLSQVLPLADMVATNGGTMSSTWIVYPAMTIKVGETVTKTFKVRIKESLNAQLTYQLRNTYGNTIVINVPGQVIYQAPKTGAAGTSAAAFAGLITAGFVVARKRGSILKFIFA